MVGVKGSYCLMDTEFQFEKMKIILEMDSGYRLNSLSVLNDSQLYI